MPSPDDRRYRQTHEWHKLEDEGTVQIGISAFAVEELTDITFVEVSAEPGETLQKGDSFGEIESVKATSELYAGVGGEIVEVNDAVIDNPELINEDPWEKGWILRLKPADPAELEELLDAEAYDQQQG